MLRKLLKQTLRATYPYQHFLIRSRAEFPFLLNALKLTGIGAEIGVKHGTYSQYLLTHWRGQKLFSIDPYFESAVEVEADGRVVTQISHDACYARAREKLAPFGARSTLLREASPQAAEHFRDGALDFCYIDALHQYEPVLLDMEAWFPKVKRGGILAGHDYINGEWRGVRYGVKTAVDEFCRANNVRAVISHETDTPSWFIFKPRAG